MAGTRKPTPLAPLYGRIGGLRLAATHDPKVYTAAARRAFAESFERQVDPDRVLPPEERARRTLAAKKAHYADLAYRSAVARAARKHPSPGHNGAGEAS
jgi:hypothetical protein